MSLEKEGFVIIKNKYSIKNIDNIRSNITDINVNYPIIDKFIRNNMINIINTNMNWNAVYTKYRVSNNNNSTDAAVFHRDLIYYTSNKPIFTCLTYLDNTIMEVIPFSHNKISMSYSEILYLKPKKIYMEAGDILIFYSSLIHRGLFTENSKNRRLIQVFEVYRNNNDFIKYNNKILQLPAIVKNNTNILRNINIYISKIKSLINIASSIILLNAATGYGYNGTNNINNNYNMFSSEGMQDRYYDITKIGPINKYIMMQKTNDATLEETIELKYILLERQIYIYILIFCICIIAIFFCLYKTI
jgi:hypothetical protein